MKVYIRADANPTIATGHVLRCASIAAGFLDRGMEVCFIVADKVSGKVVSDLGFDYYTINSKFDDMEGELPLFLKFFNENPGDLILVDSYFATEKYLREIGKLPVKVAVIDDFMDGILPCDVVINYAVYADSYFYQRNYPGAEHILGCKYVPLRKEFQNLPNKEILQEVKNVLVMCGGADPYHFILNFIKGIKSGPGDFMNVCFTIICGRFNSDFEEIKKMAEDMGNVTILSHTDKLHEYMQRADMAVSAGGSTLYELCAAGVPTLSYCLADNQLNNVLGFHEKGIIEYLGDVRDEGFSYEDVLNRIKALAEDFDGRIAQSRRMQELVDGRGAERIAGEVVL